MELFTPLLLQCSFYILYSPSSSRAVDYVEKLADVCKLKNIGVDNIGKWLGRTQSLLHNIHTELNYA